MHEVCLDDGTISYEGEWLSADELTTRIKKKMDTGDMKFASLAIVLEELNKTLENSKKLELKIVTSKEDYEKLKSIGGDDDRECVRKAIMAYIESLNPLSGMASKGKVTVIKCLKCQFPIEIPSENKPSIIECPECGTSGRLTPKNKWMKAD